jgi:hypothetical protein
MPATGRIGESRRRARDHLRAERSNLSFGFATACIVDVAANDRSSLASE